MENDLTRTVHRFGPAGLVIKPLVQVFAPLRVGKPIWEYPVTIANRPLSRAEGLSDRYCFFWLNILMWPFVAPLLLLGIYKAMGAGLTPRALAIIFFLLVAVVAFISYQPRHSLAFRVLVPTFISFAWWLPRSHNERYFLLSMRYCFTGSILVLNTMELLR